MNLKMLLAACGVAMLTGCASVDKSITCTDNHREVLQSRNAALVERKKEIEDMLTWDRSLLLVRSRTMLTYEDYTSHLVKSYNRSVETLEAEAALYNSVCTGPGT